MAADVHADKESEAYGYAGRLAEALHRKHFAHVVNWQPLDTVLGVLTQIDNMTSGLQSAEEGRNEEHLTSNAKLADEIEREGVERVVYGMDLTNTRKLNRQLIDALRATHSATEGRKEADVLQEAIEYLHLRLEHDAALMLKRVRHQMLLDEGRSPDRCAK